MNQNESTLATAPRPYVDRTEAAAILRISIRMLTKLVSARKLRPARIGRRVIFKRNDIERFVEVQMALSS